MKRITIKDIAKMLNINPSTVSRALSNHPDVSAQTKKRVEEIAKQFKYKPNLQARYFRKKHSGLIAIILPQINKFFSADFLEGVNAELYGSEYSSILFQSGNRLDQEIQLIDYCQSWAIEGLLLSVSGQTFQLDHLNTLYDFNIPVVLVDRVLNDKRFSTVTIDDKKTSFVATEHLIKKGHKRIVGFFGNPSLQMAKQRHAGFIAALDKYNIKHDTENSLFFTETKQSDIILKVKGLQDYSAIFCMSDELLVDVHYAINSLAWHIPNDKALVCISDGNPPNYLYPKISHIKHSGFDVGKEATRLLLSKIRSQNLNVEHVKLHVEMIEGAST